MAETDHPLKRLLALAAADFATWLLNQPVRRVTTRPGELTAIPDPIDTDQVLFVTLDDGRELILHIEFQGLGSHKPVPLRLLEYNTRMILTYRDLPMYRVVIYLGGAGHGIPASMCAMTWRGRCGYRGAMMCCICGNWMARNCLRRSDRRCWH